MKEKEAGLERKTVEEYTGNSWHQSNQVLCSSTRRSGEEYCFPASWRNYRKLILVAGSTDAGKPMLTVMISDNLVAGGLKAGNLVKEAAKLIQGGGGGQPHFATAGGKNPDGLNAAVEKVLELAGI